MSGLQNKRFCRQWVNAVVLAVFFLAFSAAPILSFAFGWFALPLRGAFDYDINAGQMHLHEGAGEPVHVFSTPPPKAQVPTGAGATSQPNILLIIADDMRPDCLGVYGNPNVAEYHLTP